MRPGEMMVMTMTDKAKLLEALHEAKAIDRKHQTKWALIMAFGIIPGAVCAAAGIWVVLRLIGLI